MQSSANKNKKMVMNIKKRKSSESKNAPKAKTPRKSGSSVGGVAPISPKAQTPKLQKVVKTPATKRSAPMKPRPMPMKRKGNENIQASPKFTKRNPAKNASKKNLNQKTPVPKIIKEKEPEESDEAEESEEETKSSEDEQESVESSPVFQQGLNKIEGKKSSAKKHSSQRLLVKEKLLTLREKIQNGDKTAVTEVEEKIKEIQGRGELSRTARRKLQIYKRLLKKNQPAPTAKPTKAIAKAKKAIKKNN